jgi:hypothetical protein
MKLHLGLSLIAVIALAGCANGPAVSHPVQDPATAAKEHQREEALNEAQARADRYKGEVEMCQKTVAEAHVLLDEVTAKAQQYYREAAPVVKQGAADAVHAGTVWVQKQIDEHTGPTSK